MQEDYGECVASDNLLCTNHDNKDDLVIGLDCCRITHSENASPKLTVSVDNSPDSQKLPTKENVAYFNQLATNSISLEQSNNEKKLNSSSKSSSPTAESNRDCSSSSLSTLASSSKLSGEEIDFVKFYFENCRSPAQTAGSTIHEISEPVSISRILDCSPIQTINFDDTAVKFSTPISSGFPNEKPDIAPAQFAIDEFTPIKRTVDRFVNESTISLSYAELPAVSLRAPVNSPNNAAGVEIPVDSTPVCNQQPDFFANVERNNTLSTTLAESGSLESPDDSPEILQPQLNFTTRPPCIGQEHSPESDETSFLGCNVAASKNPPSSREIQAACRVSRQTLNSDIDLTEINPPSPVLMHSARKVGSWLRRLQEEAELSEYSEHTLVDQSTTENGSKIRLIPCAPPGLDRIMQNKCKKRSSQFSHNFIGGNTTRLSGKTISSNCQVASQRKKCLTCTTKASEVNNFAALRAASNVQVSANLHEIFPRRHFKRNYRAPNKETHVRTEFFVLPSEDEAHSIEKLSLCRKDALTAPSPLSMHTVCTKRIHNLDIGDNQNNSDGDKGVSEHDSKSVYRMARTAKSVGVKTHSSNVNRRHLLSRKLKAIGLYIRHKNVTHSKFKTLAIV